MMRQTDEFCSGYLYTHIDTEGTMSGFPFEVIAGLKAATSRKLIVAGGIKSMDEVKRLDAAGVDCRRGHGRVHRCSEGMSSATKLEKFPHPMRTLANPTL